MNFEKKISLETRETPKMCVHKHKSDLKVHKNRSVEPDLSSRTPTEILHLLIDV